MNQEESNQIMIQDKEETTLTFQQYKKSDSQYVKDAIHEPITQSTSMLVNKPSKLKVDYSNHLETTTGQNYSNSASLILLEKTKQNITPSKEVVTIEAIDDVIKIIDSHQKLPSNPKTTKINPEKDIKYGSKFSSTIKKISQFKVNNNEQNSNNLDSNKAGVSSTLEQSNVSVDFDKSTEILGTGNPTIPSAAAEEEEKSSLNVTTEKPSDPNSSLTQSSLSGNSSIMDAPSILSSSLSIEKILSNLEELKKQRQDHFQSASSALNNQTAEYPETHSDVSTFHISSNTSIPFVSTSHLTLSLPENRLIEATKAYIEYGSQTRTTQFKQLERTFQSTTNTLTHTMAQINNHVQDLSNTSIPMIMNNLKATQTQFEHDMTQAMLTIHSIQDQMRVRDEQIVSLVSKMNDMSKKMELNEEKWNSRFESLLKSREEERLARRGEDERVQQMFHATIKRINQLDEFAENQCKDNGILREALQGLENVLCDKLDVDREVWCQRVKGLEEDVDDVVEELLELKSVFSTEKKNDEGRLENGGFGILGLSNPSLKERSRKRKLTENDHQGTTVESVFEEDHGGEHAYGFDTEDQDKEFEKENIHHSQGKSIENSNGHLNKKSRSLTVPGMIKGVIRWAVGANPIQQE